jgi:hypothetical protein
MKQSKMSYVIACWKKNLWHGIQVIKNDDKPQFKLVPLDSQTNVSKLFNNPHRTQMEVFIDWIKENDKQLGKEKYSVEDYGRFRR